MRNLPPLCVLAHGAWLVCGGAAAASASSTTLAAAAAAAAAAMACLRVSAYINKEQDT